MPALTKAQIALLLGVSTAKVDRMVRDGVITSTGRYRTGTRGRPRLLFECRSLLDQLDRHAETDTPRPTRLHNTVPPINVISVGELTSSLPTHPADPDPSSVDRRVFFASAGVIRYGSYVAGMRPGFTGKSRLMAVAGHSTSPHDAALGERLKVYWTKGPGLARWSTNPHPWTTLHRLLLAIPLKEPLATRLTETYFVAVFGFHGGSRKGKNPVGPG